MEDTDKGDASPKSGAQGTKNPQTTGRRRRRWRKRKKGDHSGPAGENVAGANASGAKQNNMQAGSANSAGVEPCGTAGGHSSSTKWIAGLGGNKKSRRRRRRRKAREALPVQDLQQTDTSGEHIDTAQRHRRQPMQQVPPASFRKKRPERHRQRDGAYQDTNGSNQKRANETGIPRPPKKARTYYAALDLGTNNCRLLVALPQAPGRFRVVDAFSRIVRLGEGLGASGRLSDVAMDRTIEALRVCSGKLQQRINIRYRLIATEACRRAENGPQFLERVLEQTGLSLEIVDRETEARLAVSGCGSLVDRDADGIVLFDIGGGSSELALLDIGKRRSRRLSDHITSWASLPLGVVTLSEKFGGGKHVNPDTFEDMVVDVAEMLNRFEGRNALAHTLGNGNFHLLGTSGTVTTLAGVHLNLPRYDRRRVDGAWLSDRQVDAMINRILNMSFEDRVNNPCIGADRADLVLAGCAILEAIRRLWPSPRLRVADRGLREGLLTEMMAEDGVWRRNRKRSARGRTQDRSHISTGNQSTSGKNRGREE